MLSTNLHETVKRPNNGKGNRKAIWPLKKTFYWVIYRSSFLFSILEIESFSFLPKTEKKVFPKSRENGMRGNDVKTYCWHLGGELLTWSRIMETSSQIAILVREGLCDLIGRLSWRYRTRTHKERSLRSCFYNFTLDVTVPSTKTSSNSSPCWIVENGWWLGVNMNITVLCHFLLTSCHSYLMRSISGFQSTQLGTHTGVFAACGRKENGGSGLWNWYISTAQCQFLSWIRGPITWQPSWNNG